MERQILKIKKATGQLIKKSEDVYNIMKEEAMADRECVWILHLNPLYRIIEKELVGMGTTSCVSVSPREVFKKAIINNSAFIICVHNHPNNWPSSSEADDDFFVRLIKVSDSLGIPVLDFIIIGQDDYLSFYCTLQTKPIKDYFGQIEMFEEQEGGIAIHNLG